MKKVDSVSDRLLIVRMADPVDLNIIVVYMPTSAYEDQDVDDVYEQIEEKTQGVHCFAGRYEFNGWRGQRKKCGRSAWIGNTK